MRIHRYPTALLGISGILLAVLFWMLGSRHYAYVRDLEEIVEIQRTVNRKLNLEVYAFKEAQAREQDIMQNTQERKDREQKEMDAEEASLARVAQTSAIAAAFTFAGIPDDFTEYCDEELGFCFSYPPSWGTVKVNTYFPCNGDTHKSMPDFSRRFSNKSDGYSFGASAESYLPQSQCSTERGGSYFDRLPNADLSTADATISIGDTRIGMWYAQEVGWETHDYDFAFSAPTRHPLATRMAFRGPTASSPELTQQEIYDFLTVAHSYRLREE